MHSGSRNGLNGFVTNEELQAMLLPLILETYRVRNYSVLRFPPNESLRRVALADTRQFLGGVPWLRVGKIKNRSDLETLLQTQPVDRLEPGIEYLASPDSAFHRAQNEADSGSNVEYRGIAFSPYNFIVCSAGILVPKLETMKIVHLSFYEFYTAIEKWLPPTTHKAMRSSKPP